MPFDFTAGDDATPINSKEMPRMQIEPPINSNAGPSSPDPCLCLNAIQQELLAN